MSDKNSKPTFKYFALCGMDRTEVKADGVEIVCSDGRRFEMHGRISDGEVVVSAGRRLVIHPWASNCVRVEDDLS